MTVAAVYHRRRYLKDGGHRPPLQDDLSRASQLTALGLGLQDPNESGLVASLQPNAYTAILAGKNGGTGIGLVEIYNLH